MSFIYDDICRAFQELEIQRGDTVLVRADLRYLGPYGPGIRQLPKDLYGTLVSLVGLDGGTIVTPTASMRLCNTDQVFDPATTASEMGVLAEHIRTQPGAHRSFHPFLSYAAVGEKAASLCGDVARHGFGPETPKARLIDMGAKMVSIGLPPNLSCTTVHHAELMMGVPYRYVKEFMQPVMRNEEVAVEPFYLYVWYRECDIRRSLNKDIMGSFRGLRRAALGGGFLTSYLLTDFYAHCVQCFKKDIYCWLAEEPVNRPYRR